MRLERGESGVYRLVVWRWLAIGFEFPRMCNKPRRWKWKRWLYLSRYQTGGWSLRLLCFHVGWKRDRWNWTHYRNPPGPV